MFAYLLALNFAFSKIKMFKLLFILFVIKQVLGNLTSDVNTYSAKLSITWLGKVSGGNSDRNIAQLSALFFASIYPILRVLIFTNGKFLKISSF